MYLDVRLRSTDEYLYSFSPGSFSCRTYMVARLSRTSLKGIGELARKAERRKGRKAAEMGQVGRGRLDFCVKTLRFVVEALRCRDPRVLAQDFWLVM